MSENRKKSSKTRQISSSAPPQIANFFSKPLSPSNEMSPSSTASSLNDRKRKLSDKEASSQNENSNTYAQAIQKDAAKISKVRKTKKVSTTVSTFFQQGASDDLSDIFESPHKRMQFKPPPALPKQKVTRKRKLVPTKQSKKKNVLETELFEKVLIHHSTADGLNSDELQMALALSRSLTNTTHISNGESCSMSSMIRGAEPSEKADIIKRTFQKFGFKKRDSNEYDYRDFFAITGSKKKWFSKFTPLTRRSEYMQNAKFKNKVKNILKISEAKEDCDCEAVQEYSITSSYLQQFFISNCPSYNLNSANTDNLIEEFYVNDLVPISTIQCGCLLKNWSDIPGRDASPKRNSSEPCDVNNSTMSSGMHNESTSTQVVEQRKTEEQINLSKCDVEPDSYKELSDMSKSVKRSTVDDEEVELQQIQSSSEVVHSHNGQQWANLSNHSLNADHSTGDINVPNERQLLSPDMFADYESSANNSLNDDALPENYLIDALPDHLSDHNSGVSLNTTKDSHHSRSPNEAPVHQQKKAAIVISSDESNQGCAKAIVESIIVTSQPKLLDIPLIASIAKRLSFTDRLRMYNSDPALENSDDDPALGYTDDNAMCKLSQESIVISDDEVNYSLNRGADDEEHYHAMKMHSQESIVLSDSDDQMNSQLAEHDIEEERQSFASIEMSNKINSDDSIVDCDSVNLSVRELCEMDSVSSSEIHRSTISNLHSKESIVLSDSDDDQMGAQLPEYDERQSFVSVEIGNETVNEKSLDINIDDDMFNDSLNDEDLINLSVREMCQKEFVTGSAKASTSMSLSRTTSDMTFERKLWKPSRTPNKLKNFSDDELDEFDKLVRGDRHQSPILKEKLIEISDDELDKSVKSQSSDNIRGDDDDENVLHSSTATECNEFIVQSMDQIYEVRTGKLVSPKPDFEKLDSPTRLVHLKKYGLKTLSKRKAVICLEHIYNRLHPFIELNERDDLDNILSQKKVQSIGSSQNRKDDMDTHPVSSKPIVDSQFDAVQEGEDVFFLPSAPRAKKPWCLQPLHIAWHNLINSDPTLYDDILQYKPVDLICIRGLLKSIDLRYETNDLISFLDRKCITFKTENKRNQVALKKNRF